MRSATGNENETVAGVAPVAALVKSAIHWPALVKFAGWHRTGHAPWDLDVPLLVVFPYEQYRAAIAGRLNP